MVVGGSCGGGAAAGGEPRRPAGGEAHGDPGLTRLGLEQRRQLAQQLVADRDHLKQVLLNLMLNGVQAMSPGGTLSLEAEAGRDGVTIAVGDTGPGIPPETLARIFDPYVTTRKIGEGMGLGLSISRKVMIDHGGDLQLVDSSERGTTFRLSFGDAACA